MYKISVYQLCNLFDNYIYIRSTKSPLYKQLYEHKSLSQKKPNQPIYKYINETGSWDNWRILLIAEYEVNSRQEMLKKEQDNINEYKNNQAYILLNKRKAYQTKEQRKKQQLENSQTEKRKLHIKIYGKKYKQTEKYKQN